MEIIFLFRSGPSFSADIMNKVKARLPMNNPEVASRIEYINTDKRNIEKLLKKREAEGNLPTTIYLSVDKYHINLKPIFKKYPEIRIYEYSTRWEFILDDIKNTMNQSFIPKTYYGVPYNQYNFGYDWCGEIQEVTIGLFDKMLFPCFVTKKEAEEFARIKLEEKIRRYIRINEHEKQRIKDREKFIKQAFKKIGK